MRDKIISLILILIIIGIIGISGIFGYIIYTEVLEDGTLEISFEEETGFPTIEYLPLRNNTTNVSLDEDMFSGVEGNSISTTTEQTEKIQSRNLYNQLDDTGKTIYNGLYQNKENLKTGTYKIDYGNAFQSVLSQENGDVDLKKQYQSAIEALVYENPDIFYIDVTKMYINIEKVTKITGTTYNVFIDNGNEISYFAEGFYSKEDVEKYEKQIEQVRDEIISNIEGKSNYDKIKIVHDYLVETIQYENDLNQENIYDIYGALITKRCVCEGYAKAFQYIMNEVGIENVIVIGTATNSKNETENHAWNYVKLDGQWYAIDVTWDDPIVKGGGILTDIAKYEYFLRGSETMKENHYPSGKFTENGKVFTYPELNVEDCR